MKTRNRDAVSDAKKAIDQALFAIAGRKVQHVVALEEWKTWREKNAEPNTVRTQYLTIRAGLRMFDGEKWPCLKLDYDQLDAYVNAKDATSRGTRDTRLAAMKSYFLFLTARGYRLDDPTKLIKVRMKGLTLEQKEGRPTHAFTKKEVDHILANTEGFWRWAVALSYWAGLRLSDVCALEWASLKSDEIVVYPIKNDTTIRVALPLDDPLIGGGFLRTIIMEMMEFNTDKTYVFPDDRAAILDPQRRAKYSVYFGRVLEELGMKEPGKSFHSARHSFATRLEAAGKTIEDIGRMMGHTRASTRSGVTAGYIEK